MLADDIHWTPSWIAFQGRLYILSGSAANRSQVASDESNTIEYPKSVNCSHQIGQLSPPTASDQMTYTAEDEPIQAMEQETTDRPMKPSAADLVEPGLGISTVTNAPYGTEELQEPEPQ